MDTSIVLQNNQSRYLSNGGIYQFRQLSTGRKYIGSTHHFRERRNDHIRKLNGDFHDNPYFLSAWKKYGSDDFVFEIIEIIDDKSKLLDREQWYLDFVIDWANDFNIAKIAACPPNGSGRKGKKWSDETRRKFRESRLGKKVAPATQERKANIAKAKMGGIYKKHSAESNKKKSERQLGKKKKPYTPEQKREASILSKKLGLRPPSRKGTTTTPETKKKISEASKRYQAKLREERKKNDE